MFRGKKNYFFTAKHAVEVKKKNIFFQSPKFMAEKKLFLIWKQAVKGAG